MKTPASLPDLFGGRRQLIVSRVFSRATRRRRRTSGGTGMTHTASTRLRGGLATLTRMIPTTNCRRKAASYFDLWKSGRGDA